MVPDEDHLFLTSCASCYVPQSSQAFLEVLNISAPTSPIEVGFTEVLSATNYFAETILLAVSGDYAYVGHSRLEVIDIADPSLPRVAASHEIEGSISKIEAANDYLFVLHEQGELVPGHFMRDRFLGGLQIYSLAQSPSALVEVAFHRAPLYPRDIVVDWNMIYTANGPEGVFAYWFAPPAMSVVTSGTTALLESPFDRTSYRFPSGSFSDTVVVTHTAKVPDEIPAFGQLVGIDHGFVVTAVNRNTRQPATILPGQVYTVTIHYSDAQRAGVIESALALHFWDGQAWQVEPSSKVDTHDNVVTATPNQMGQFAILGQTHRHFLPILSVR